MDNGLELQTLPNIDINIKTGNSLISRFGLNASLANALKRSNWRIEDYRKFVKDYKNAGSREEKQGLQEMINQIKKDFRTEINRDNPKQKRLNKLSQELYDKYTGNKLFEEQLTKKQKQDRAKLEKEITKLQKEIDDLKNNEIYRNAFEWRFEFPEVLDDEGNFLGFDVVIGNPPYISSKVFGENMIDYLKINYKTTQYQPDLYIAFIEKGITILKENRNISFITPNSWLKNIKFDKCRKFLVNKVEFYFISPNLENVFEEASVDTLIFMSTKNEKNGTIKIGDFIEQKLIIKHSVKQNRFSKNDRYIFDVGIDDKTSAIFQKVKTKSKELEYFTDITRGVNPYDKYRGQSEDIIKNKRYHSNTKKDETFIPEIRGKHVFTYQYKWDGQHYISYGPWLAAPREKKYFNGKRIIMRQVLGQKLNCTIIEEDFIIDQSVFIAKPLPKYEPYIEIMQGLLASKLLSLYFRYKNNEFDALFPKIKIGEFKELPIYSQLNKVDKKFHNLVREITDKLKQNPSADISALEAEIDRMVYDLYGLTEEEVRIVEESV